MTYFGAEGVPAATSRAGTDLLMRIARHGLLVEMWDWTIKDLRACGVSIVSMTGYVEGDLTSPAWIAKFLGSAQRSLEAAEAIDRPRLNVHDTGPGTNGLPGNDGAGGLRPGLQPPGAAERRSTPTGVICCSCCELAHRCAVLSC